jgi:hypothetical protein
MRPTKRALLVSWLGWILLIALFIVAVAVLFWTLKG